MLDLKLLEKEPDVVAAKLARRGEIAGLSELLALVSERKRRVHEAQILQEQRNQASDSLKSASKDVIDAKRTELRALSTTIKEHETTLKDLEARLEQLALTIPNIPSDDVPNGSSEDDNVLIRTIGILPEFSFKVRDHIELGEKLNIIDFERAAKVSGARFAFLRGQGSQLNRALIQYMSDFHTARGDTELTPPYLVREEALYGVGQLPKFKEDVFEVPFGEKPLYLISTAEVPVTNFFADEILPQEQLPLRMFAYSACFRSEAGSAGKDTRGLIRVHQFEKVEMVRFATPEQAAAEHEEMIDRASTMLTELGLPHRIMALCMGDLGFQAEKKIDLEVWLPGQNCYREVSSCSSFGTFQARRAKIRYRPSADGAGKSAKPEVLVTLNGSGLPLGRTIVAILENHQQEDGSVRIPEVLRPYMGGKSRIG